MDDSDEPLDEDGTVAEGTELDEDEETENDVPLSAELEAELEDFVLIGDWDLAVSRADTLDVLGDALRELEDDDAIEEWIADYGDSDFHLAQGRDGRLVISDVFPVTGVVGFIPGSIMRILSAELLAQAQEDREAWMESLSDLASEWLALLSDEEKIVGHLIRAHEVPLEETAEEHGQLVARHAQLHAAG